jgi:uncharacterized cupin superfamily protein
MEIEVRKYSEQELKAASSWSLWVKEPSSFDWDYDETETCLLLEGDVTVEHSGGSVRFGAGDRVVFPAGLSCKWIVHKAVRKHYRFG